MFAPQLPSQQLLAHATQLHRSGNYAAAVQVYRQLLRGFPKNPELLDKLGAALSSLGQTEEARRHIEAAIKLSPSQPIFHHDLHLTYRREGRLKQAEECIDRALKLAPRHPIFSAAKAEIKLLQGDPETAWKVLSPVRSTARELPTVALVLASLAPRVGMEQEAAEAIRTVLTRTDLTPVMRVSLGFSLGFVLDYAGDFDGAWNAVVAANQARGAGWNAEAHRTLVDEAIAAWSPEAIAAAPKAQVDASSVVLIVGMPRSGASLIAQMLATLPQSASAGERNDLVLAARELQGGQAQGAPIFTRPSSLTEEELTRRGAEYVRKLQEARPGATLISDRIAMNQLNLGLISKMLPGAKVIHCTRTPLDSGVACYMHLFAANLPFTGDPANLGAFIRDARRLMQHWSQVVDLPLLEVAYDELLSRPEVVARRVVEFVGRTWDDAVLEPARRWVQITTLPDGSMRDLVPDGRVGIAEDYQAHLGPMREALEA